MRAQVGIGTQPKQDAFEPGIGRGIEQQGILPVCQDLADVLAVRR